MRNICGAGKQSMWAIHDRMYRRLLDASDEMSTAAEACLGRRHSSQCQCSRYREYATRSVYGVVTSQQYASRPITKTTHQVIQSQPNTNVPPSIGPALHCAEVLAGSRTFFLVHLKVSCRWRTCNLGEADPLNQRRNLDGDFI